MAKSKTTKEIEVTPDFDFSNYTFNGQFWESNENKVEFDFENNTFNGQFWESNENKVEFDFENHVFDGSNWIEISK